MIKSFTKSWSRKVVVLVAVAALLLMAAPVYAATTAGVTGNITVNNNAPEGLALTLKTHGGGATNDMTPLTEYDLVITVTDDNTLADIHQIDISIFYDANAGDDGVPGGAWDCDEEAIYKWVDAGTWSMENGAATTTWTLETGDCGAPTMTDQTGNWTLAFKPGKLAVESNGTDSEWDIKVTVTDQSSGSTNTTIYSKSMAAYAEITTDVGSITFGSGVNLGDTDYIDNPVDHNFATQVLSNDAYALQVNTTATWAKGGDTMTLNTSGTPAAAGQFGLNIDDTDGGSGVPAVPQAVTTSAATITGHGTDARVATIAGASEATANQDFYMSLALYSWGILPGAYSGTITMTVVNN